MSGPSQYVREKREAAARRRLVLATMLRDDPKATNIQLAKALGVNRETIALDRKVLVEELQNKALNETELMRAAMVERLERLNGELEKHREKGKLPTSVLHEMHLVTRSMIELLGVRKPVVEKLEVRKRSISFQTQIVSTSKGAPINEPKTFTITRDTLALKGDQD